MADVNANIDINIDSSNALAQLKSLQRQISQFHTSIAKSSEAAALAQRGLQKNLLNSINAIGAFTAEMRTVRTSAESFTDSLEKNKFSMREYFRYAGASTKTFGRLFKTEFDTIGKVAEERVKRLQTQYIKMGRDTNGAMRAIAVMPTQLNMKDYTTQVQMAAQKQALFNQLMRQGSTNLLNFGKNTQWAGRQLMVGFTLPLMAVGSAATKTFMEMEAYAIKFKKVYGDLFTPKEETAQALENITELGKQFTKYGIAVSTTVGLAAEAAAAGFQGLDLQRQTREATRLSILGQIDSQKALETTISLQNAFKMSSEDLAGAIDFLNAVENQTVVSLDDITTAIPKVAPVIQQLGGNVKDLAFFMAAMKEGGVNASEGANALKSGLASLINPTEKAAAMLQTAGINIKAIVETNKGDLKATVIAFAQALDTLDPLSRARAIEQLFGKFQFARLSTLFDNVINQTGQAARVLDLAGSSIEDLASLSEQELGLTADSAMNKFRKSVEDLKVALIPVGEAFLQAVTPIIDFVSNILERFNNLSDGTKRVITLLTVGLGAVGPVLLMTFGLIANGVANLIKLFLTLRAGYQRLTGQSQILGEQTQYMTSEQIDAAAAAHSLDQTHAKLTQTFNAETSAINKLIQAYNSAAGAARNFAVNNPGMMLPPRGGRTRGFAEGIISVPGPKGAGDIVPAMLSPGEAVIPSDMAKKYAPLIQGMIAGNIPGYEKGLGLGDIKKQVGLYKAPAAILAQTGGMTWDTLNAEIQAVTEALKNTKVSQSQLSNLLRKQASHIKEDTMVVSAGGQAISVKNWKAANLTPDLGYVNNYVDTIRKNSQILDNFRKSNLDVVAKDLGMSMVEMETELQLLSKGLHPVTRRSAQVLQRVAATDPGYQGIAASAGLQARLAGNFYETQGTRQYSQASDVASVSSVNRKVAKMQQIAAQKITEQTIQQVRNTAQTASPSRRTIPIGEDIARGLQVGMTNQIDETIAAGENLANAAIQGTSKQRGGAGRAFREAGAPGPRRGIPISDQALLSMAYTENAMRDKLAKQQASIEATTRRMANLNRAFMSGTFAISALSGVASMAGGNLGKFSEILFQISGAMFAVSSILQLLTGTPIIGLIKKFKLGFGLASVALIAGVGIIKLLNAEKEKERLATIGVSEAMGVLPKQLKSLGDFFGVVPQKSAFETAADLKNRQILAPTKRSEIDKLRESGILQKEFKDQIKQLTVASNEAALLAFQSLALDLKSRGFATEQVQTIIDALREEAAQTDVVLDVKSIDFSAASTTALNATLKSNIAEFQKIYATGFENIAKVTYGAGFTSTVVNTLVPTKELQSQIANLGGYLSRTYQSLATMFRSNIINSKQYEEQLNAINAQMTILNQKQRDLVMIDAFKQVGVDATTLVNNIKDINTQTKIFTLLSAGLIDADYIKRFSAALNSEVAQERHDVIKEFNARLENFKKFQDAANKSSEDGNKILGDQGAKNALQERIKQIRNQTKAFIILRNAKIDEKTATELSNDAEIASLVIANSKGKSLKQIIKLVKEYKKAIKESTEAETKYAPAATKFKNNINTLRAQADLREKIIDIQFAPQLKAENKELEKQQDLLKDINSKIDSVNRQQIEPLQARIEANNFALDKIAIQEDAINEKYNKQIDSLDKIATLNQDIANIQKQRLSIADALTRGDISAAAELMQDARAEQAQSAITRQREGLTATRDAALAALGRNNLEKENKVLQLQITEIERGQLATLESQKRTIEDTITVINNNIERLNRQVEELKSSYEYAGKTKEELDQFDALLDAAEKAGIKFNKSLLEQAQSARELAKALESVLLAQLGAGGFGRGGADEEVGGPKQKSDQQLGKDNKQPGGGGGDKGGGKTSPGGRYSKITSTSTMGAVGRGEYTTRAPSYRINDRMFGGYIKKMRMGGVVPKYFAAGGRMGSDTVPAMLTPGEFVMNKRASQEFGPLLSMLNESKYPSMIGNKASGQIPVNNIATSINDNSTAVYNYNLGFNINGNNANANEIARAVMREVKNVDAQRIRGQRQ